MNEMEIYPIGIIENKGGNVCIKLAPKYADGLKGLGDYSHVQILWWADGCDNGIVGLYYVDAFDGTQVIDLKPYTPSIDRIENPGTPKWCSHWPKSYDESGDFDWDAEFNF